MVGARQSADGAEVHPPVTRTPACAGGTVRKIVAGSPGAEVGRKQGAGQLNWFACGRGHEVAAALTWADDSEWDPSGYFCPICMGSVVGHGDMIDSRILALVKRVCPVPARIMPGKRVVLGELPGNPRNAARLMQTLEFMANRLVLGWRRGSESNRRIRVLQTLALPLGYRADIEGSIRTLTRCGGTSQTQRIAG